MPDTIRQRIIDAIDTRFKAILITGGYATNLGSNVFAWRTAAIDESELDALVYRDRLQSRIERASATFENNLSIEIEIFSTSIPQIRKCLADLESAIYVDPSWGGLAIWTDLAEEEMDIEQKENIFTASKVLLMVDFLTIIGDPYTQG